MEPFSNYDDLVDKNPFWFAGETLVIDLLKAEFQVIKQLLMKFSDLLEFFDQPEASFTERTACFTLLAHRRLIEELYETFTGLHQISPSLGDEEKYILDLIRNPFPGDAPMWVTEVNEVAGRLPSRIFDALPELLQSGGYYASDPEQVDVIESAAAKFRSLEKIHVLCKQVFDEQLRRLEKRWAADRLTFHSGKETIEASRIPSKRRRRRTADKLRHLRDEQIAEIDDISETITEFLQNMDERGVKPQPTWSGWPGSWVKAYRIGDLRVLIHKDKSRALARHRRRKHR